MVEYIAGLIPKDAGPNHVYFTVAGGDQHYQLQIGMLELDTGLDNWESFLPLVLKQVTDRAPDAAYARQEVD